MIWPAIAILGFVTLQRLVELPLARKNTTKLLAGNDDNSGGPAGAERAQDPDAAEFDQGEQYQKRQMDRPARSKPP